MVLWAEFCAFHFTVRNYLPDIKLAFELTKAQVITEGKGFHHCFNVLESAWLIFENYLQRISFEQRTS